MYKISPSWIDEAKSAITTPINGVSNTSWNDFKTRLDLTINSGSYVNNYEPVIRYIQPFPVNLNQISGTGVLNLNGDVVFVPSAATSGVKISKLGVISTYSLPAGIVGSDARYSSGAMAPNGDIHFSCLTGGSPKVGLKVSFNGVASTYSLVYTDWSGNGYDGGVVNLNGDIHFVPFQSKIGQKVSSSGVVSTYSLVYTDWSGVDGGYAGGVLDANGDIHFVPYTANVGQKVSSSGVVSTYTIPTVSTITNIAKYSGGVLDPDGNIHFMAFNITTGMKISKAGVITTYSLPTTSSAYAGNACLGPDGYIYCFRQGTGPNFKISSDGIVTTFRSPHTSNNFIYGVMPTINDSLIVLSGATGNTILSYEFKFHPTVSLGNLIYHPFLN